MGYQSRGAKVRVELVEGGTEVLVSANREGLRYLAEICCSLADEEYDQHKPPHTHVEPALNYAESESVPLEVVLKADFYPIESPKWRPSPRDRDMS
jgi:hypothetical protein